MVQKTDERGNGALKVDVVFPQRIVCVDEQGLSGREAGHRSMVKAAVIHFHLVAEV
jgi:hypothetical protein